MNIAFSRYNINSMGLATILFDLINLSSNESG